MFILMTHKSQEAYESVFEFINAKFFRFNGIKTFYSDFELAMRNALKKICPHAKNKLCHFHFAQAIRRKATKIRGFIDFLHGNDEAKKVYYQLMYLPLLPAKSIESTFNEICEKADAINKNKFKEMIRYYSQQWIKKEGPRKISVFGNEIRTTSSAEGYNRALSGYCHKKGSFFWFCVSIRNQEFMKAKEFQSFAESGGLVGNHQKKEDKVKFAPVLIYRISFLVNFFVITA